MNRRCLQCGSALDGRAAVAAYAWLGKVFRHGEKVAQFSCGTCRTVYGYNYWFLAMMSGWLVLFALIAIALSLPLPEPYRGTNASLHYLQAAVGVAVLLGAIYLIACLFARFWPLKRCRQ